MIKPEIVPNTVIKKHEASVKLQRLYLHSCANEMCPVRKATYVRKFRLVSQYPGFNAAQFEIRCVNGTPSP